MSRKPTIIIRYSEASSKALQLTEAMVKRAPGKRVVETESEDPIFPDGDELFSSFIRCKTQTGVELTLTLNSSSMDYALETLIRPNLTADERKEILGEDVEPEQAELPIPAQAAEAGAGTCTEEVGTLREPTESATQSGEQEEKIEIGKISDKVLRDILVKMLINYETGDPDSTEPIDIAINEMNYAAGVIDLDETYKKEKQIDRDLTKQIAAALNVASLKIVTTEELKQLENFASSLIAILTDDDEEMQDTYIRIGDLRKELIHARYFGGADANKRYIELQEEINPNTGIPWSEYEAYELRENKLEPPPHEKIAAAAQEREKQKKAKKSRKKKQEPTWEDVEKEARKIGQHKADKTDKTDEDAADQEIDPGLLNDIDTEDSKE